METNFALNMALIITVIALGLAYLYWVKIRNDREDRATRAGQLQAIHTFLNESFADLIGSMTNKIEDHFETEYGDNHGLLVEQLALQLKNIVDYNAWVGAVSGYPGWGVHVADIKYGMTEADYYHPWTLTLQTDFVEKRDYAIPFNNIAHLIDRLTYMNEANAHLIRVIKETH